MDLEKYLPENMYTWLRTNGKNASDITLIRDKYMFVSKGNCIVKSPIFITKETLEAIINRMCKGSIYANQYTLKAGYLTLPGGNRVGVTGTCVLKDGKIEYMRNITAINIRISREIIGAADNVMKYIQNSHRIYNTLIVSPPGAGKTTLLRDIARQLGNSYRIGIVDERGEICINNNMGDFSFVLDECEKSEGIVMLLRSMSPQIILTDEIGSDNDEKVIKRLLNAGVKTICTAHGYDERDIMRRKSFKSLINEKAFERIIILSAKNGPGTVEKVIDNS